MSREAQLFSYSMAVLPFSLGGQSLPPMEEVSSQQVQRALRAAQRTGKPYFLLLGAGDGSLPDALNNALTSASNPTLLVAELFPERIRQARQKNALAWWSETSSSQILTDESPWALLLLLTMAGYTPENTAMMLHPMLSSEEKEKAQHLQKLFLGSSVTSYKKSLETPQNISLSVAAIIHPDEPHIHSFLDQIPAWVKEVVILWDAESIPAHTLSCSVPIKEAAQPLAHNFARQRNTALSLCSSEWVLFLDGDERFSQEAWDAIQPMLYTAIVNNWGGFAFPRMTRLHDKNTCRVGFGLWPDVQLRLFSTRSQAQFSGAIHEKVTSLPGQIAIPLGVPIDHFSHLFKTEAELKAKLAGFDMAAGRQLHTLNTNMPTIQCDLLQAMYFNLKNQYLVLPITP